jgi:polyisoprenoid-binding protein YceI
MRTIAVVLALAALPLFAEPRTYTVTSDGKNVAGFLVDDAFETIDGTSTKLTGTIIADPANPAGSSVEIDVDLASIDTGIALRDSDIRDKYTQPGKYPQATFKSVSVSSPAGAIAPNQPIDVTVTGDFSLHGVTKRITVPVRVVLIPESDITRSTRGAGDWIHVTAKFPVKLSEFGIHIPTSFANDTIAVRLDLYGRGK